MQTFPDKNIVCRDKYECARSGGRQDSEKYAVARNAQDHLFDPCGKALSTEHVPFHERYVHYVPYSKTLRLRLRRFHVPLVYARARKKKKKRIKQRFAKISTGAAKYTIRHYLTVPRDFVSARARAKYECHSSLPSYIAQHRFSYSTSDFR